MVDNRVERPLFIISDSRLRQQEVNEFATRISSNVREVTMRESEKQIAEFYFRRYQPIPLVTELTGLYIRPFWRDRIRNEEIPPLPVIGKSGKIYKHSQKIPFWEY